MADKTELPNGNGNNANAVDNDRQGIFDTRFSEVMDGFGATCERYNIETSIAIAVHPNESRPLILLRGHHYDLAALLAKILRQLKGEMAKELDC